MLKVSEEEVVCRPQVAHGGAGGVFVGAEHVDEAVGEPGEARRVA